jgi:hypothetical protein
MPELWSRRDLGTGDVRAVMSVARDLVSDRNLVEV